MGPLAVPYADMLMDGPEIGTLVVVVDRARNLPNRRTMGKQDPYCAMRLGKEARKTTADRRGGQTPRWDQELRFNVRETPDHYKLKCSVFHDDKKTELIGEAWIDLKALIVPGGGQNDLWHQLNFKGKYAGDIRIEMTYYDTRENAVAEAVKEKRRAKSAATSDIMGTTSSARQLGPREVKRRPLPPNPDQNPDSSAADSQLLQTHRKLSSQSVIPQREEDQEQSWHLQHQQPQQQYQEMPQLTLDAPKHQHYYNQQYHHQQQSQFDNDYNSQSQDWGSPQVHDVFAPNVDHHAAYNPYESQENALPAQEYYDDHSASVYGPHSVGEYNRSSPNQSNASPNDHRPVLAHSYTEPLPDWHQHSSPTYPSHQVISSPQSSPHSSPPVHQSPPNLPEVPPKQHRISASPTKYTPHRDSPLRQSIASYEVPPQMSYFHDASGDPEFSAPPPPPTHGNAISLRSSSSQNVSPQAAPQQMRQLPQPLPTVGDHGALQMVKHHYQPQTQPQPQMQPQLQPQPQPQQQQQQQPQQQRALPQPPECKPIASDTELVAGEFPAPHQLTQNFGIDFAAEPVEQDHSGRYIRRNSAVEDGPYRLPQRAHTFDVADVFDERNTYRSEPHVVRPRAVSPNPAHLVPRKSISPHPQAQAERERSGLGSVPFGPDSYQVLNPDSAVARSRSPTIDNESQAPSQNEEDNSNNQEPIIGNDGRVIDPSDHLPSHTWAPEPERKERKPEHVVRIRTRDEARHSHSPSSPLSFTSTSATGSPCPPRQPPSHQSPHQSPHSLPHSAHQSPPNSTPHRRNRLQKPMPVRTPPSQPINNENSIPPSLLPARDMKQELRNSAPSTLLSGPGHRHSMYSTPPSAPHQGIQRPPLSEYQMTPSNYHNNRASYHAPSQYTPPAPTNMPEMRLQTYVPPQGGYTDPLVAEMSMIDIGPSRGAKTTLRSKRGYSGY